MGKMFKPKKETKRIAKKISPVESRFYDDCRMYGLTPDFFEHLCFKDNGDPLAPGLLLQGLDHGCGIMVSENRAVYSMHDIEDVFTMLENELFDELANVQAKAEVLGYDLIDDKTAVKEARADIKRRLNQVKEAKTIYNGDMYEIFEEMGLPRFPGCIHMNKVCEFVSYRPEVGYVLANLEYNGGVNKFYYVTFEKLKEGLKKFALELDSDDVIPWVQMAENVKPAEWGKSDTADEQQQLFFSF